MLKASHTWDTEPEGIQLVLNWKLTPRKARAHSAERCSEASEAVS